MRKAYDFSHARRNPYAKRLKKQITIDYFRALSDEIGVPYQTLINLYLQDCAAVGKRPSTTWKPAASGHV